MVPSRPRRATPPGDQGPFTGPFAFAGHGAKATMAVRRARAPMSFPRAPHAERRWTLSQIDSPCGPGCPSTSEAIAVSFVAACVLFGFSDGLQSLVRLAAFIECGKHQIRIHRLLKRCRLGIMAVADIRQIAPQLFQQVDKLGGLLLGQ